MQKNQLDEKIEVVRKFNRFYTKKIGLLERGLLKTRFSLIQARILFELAKRGQSQSSDLVSNLDIDPGYISRILSSFEKDDLIKKTKSNEDNRRQLLTLTSKGKEVFSDLNERSKREVETMLKNLSGEERNQLVYAMQTTENILKAEQKPGNIFILRPHKPGDIGWMTFRHGVLYSEEYGLDETFEALVADILAKFIKRNNLKKERIWLAECDGDRAGSIMIEDAGDEIAQLRLFLVEPKARRKGLGKRLIEECIDFSRRQDYKKIKLWTLSNLLDARGLYSKAGFKIVEEKSIDSYGRSLVSEIWEMAL